MTIKCSTSWKKEDDWFVAKYAPSERRGDFAFFCVLHFIRDSSNCHPASQSWKHAL